MVIVAGEHFAEASGRLGIMGDEEPRPYCLLPSQTTDSTKIFRFNRYLILFLF